MERAMGIESTSEVWESTKLFVGQSAAFMRPRCRRGSIEKAQSSRQFRCIAAPRNHSRNHSKKGRMLHPAFFFWVLRARKSRADSFQAIPASSAGLGAETREAVQT
jgi:hypothetical protein